MTADAGDFYAGLTPAECQVRVLQDLRAIGLIRGEEPYTHTVPFSHRSGARVEPIISLQWFCDMSRLAEPAIAAVEAGPRPLHAREVRRRLPQPGCARSGRGASAASSGGATRSRSGTAATRSTSA